MNTQQTIAALCLGASVVTAWDSQAITPAVISQTLDITVDPSIVIFPFPGSEESRTGSLSNLRLFYGSFFYNPSTSAYGVSYGSVLLSQGPLETPTVFNVPVSFEPGADYYSIALAGTYFAPGDFPEEFGWYGVTVGVRPGMLVSADGWPFSTFENFVHDVLAFSDGDVGQFPAELLDLGFLANGSPDFGGLSGPLFSFSEAVPSGNWSVNATAVPEPATVGAGLSLGGLMGWMWISRRRKA
jgi:hypothetical protein